MPLTSPQFEATDFVVHSVLAVVRLGDLDHRGWWQSHGLDETGSFVLQRSFKRTWAATAMELSMASARVRHDEALGRADAVHIFSDELPLYRLVESWLLEQKLDDDMSAFEQYRTATTEELFEALPGSSVGERRGGGLFLGSVTRADLDDQDRMAKIVDDLLGGYREAEGGFVAPYVDLAP